ncbi:MAG: ABC transporter ATP-binding protein [Ruminococcaceae bacterium]|nr:ABC transporter ATP-binding protein [Oscillospiraceae bacterium]
MKSMRGFLKYYKPYIGIMAVDLLCAAFSSVCELVFPVLVREITNRASAGTLVMSIILQVGGIYVLLRLLDTFANYYMSDIGHVMGARLETDMRRDLFSHLQKLSFRFYDNAKVGQIMSRITHDLFDITEFSHHCPEEFFVSGIKILGSFIILLRVNVPLTLILFLLLPLMLLSRILLRGRMKKAFQYQREQVGELNAAIEDNLLGIRVVKSFANEGYEQDRFEEGNRRFLGAKRRAYKYMALFHGGIRFFDGVMYIAVIVIGALFLLGGKITPGDFLAYLLYIQMLIASLRRLVEFTEQFQRGTTGIERFMEIMNEPVAIADRAGAGPLVNVQGKVQFDNVSFRYAEGDKTVLSHIDLTVRPGENVALVGPSGGGKTTLCNLIPRFYEAVEGRILIDGQDVRDVTVESLRRNIGVVQQDVYLFSGTVGENILYGRPEADRSAVEEAARAAGAHEFIEALPNGYDTYVGERGVKLSGGQKQRIAIARLFLKNPPILILDEATSALDNESERLVQASLDRLAKGRTTFTIAHRLTTVRNADRILVLTDKGIEESGTHASLLEKDGIYAKLHKLYT